MKKRTTAKKNMSTLSVETQKNFKNMSKIKNNK